MPCVSDCSGILFLRHEKKDIAESATRRETPNKYKKKKKKKSCPIGQLLNSIKPVFY